MAHRRARLAAGRWFQGVGTSGTKPRTTHNSARQHIHTAPGMTMQHINSTFTKSQTSTEGLSSTIRNMMLKIAKASHKTRTTKPNRAIPRRTSICSILLLPHTWTNLMPRHEPLKSGDEYDALTRRGKRVHRWRPGQRKPM